MRTIEVVINPAGEAVVQTKGFTGSACKDASKALERALGIIESDTPTAELYQPQNAQEKLEQR